MVQSAIAVYMPYHSASPHLTLFLTIGPVKVIRHCHSITCLFIDDPASGPTAVVAMQERELGLSERMDEVTGFMKMKATSPIPHGLHSAMRSLPT